LILITAFTFIHYKQLSNFLDLEQTYTLQNTERVQEAILTEQTYLDSKIQDWSSWDDTYNFIEDRDQQYIISNIQNMTFIGLKINTIILVNETGSVVYANTSH
jgi:sensor domain CHASE-containing protein